MLYRSIGHLPELQSLSPSERRSLIRKHIDWFVRAKLIVLPLAAGAMPSAAGFVLIANRIWPVAGAGLIAFGMFATVYTYKDLVRRCRRGIRQALLEAEADGIFITCPVCNYDLRGSTTGRCPECGRTVSAKQQSSSQGRKAAEGRRIR